MASELWKPDFSGLLVQRLAQAGSLDESAASLVLASTMPLDSTRTAIWGLLTRGYEDGPRALEAAGLLARLNDPGLVVLVKMLPRAELRPKDNKGRQRRPEAEVAELWQYACEDLVRAWCERFFAASRSGAQPSGQGPEMPIALHPNAELEAQYYLDWPTAAGDKLTSVSTDPLKVYYVRTRQRARVSIVQDFYERKMSSPTVNAIQNGGWLESSQKLDDGWYRSIDAVFTTVEDLSRKKITDEVDWTIELLVIDLRTPGLVAGGN
jgi:hypothetical protein